MLQSIKKPLSIALVVIVAGFVLGFRVGHPHSGLRSALGSAESSIALYKHIGEPMIGTKVVVAVPGEPKNSPALGLVKTVSQGTVEVQFGNRVEVITIKEIQGKLIAVVPFFGSLVGLLGL